MALYTETGGNVPIIMALYTETGGDVPIIMRDTLGVTDITMYCDKLDVILCFVTP
jgi:hypothetical protein